MKFRIANFKTLPRFFGIESIKAFFHLGEHFSFYPFQAFAFLQFVDKARIEMTQMGNIDECERELILRKREE